jgi:hypothetical protein
MPAPVSLRLPLLRARLREAVGDVGRVTPVHRTFSGLFATCDVICYNGDVKFADAGTADVYDGTDSKAARRTLPVDLWRVAQRKLTQLDSAGRLDDLLIRD